MKKTKVLLLLLTVMVTSLLFYSSWNIFQQSVALNFIERVRSDLPAGPVAGTGERKWKDGGRMGVREGNEPASDTLQASTKEPDIETVKTTPAEVIPVAIATKLQVEVSKKTPSPSTWQERAKFQQIEVEKFCQVYNMADMKFRLPTANQETDAYYRHMLVDDKAKTIYCFIPKVGCTSLSVLFFINQGLLPESEAQQPRGHINRSRLESLIAKRSFWHLNDTQRVYTLKNYFKFIMYRNPLERLVSGYRSKVQRYPLIGTEWGSPPYNWLRRAVYKFKQPKEYKGWSDAGSKTPVQISFPDFIDYWLSQPPALRQDEHFRPITELCHPCRSRFDYYGNFRHFEEDAAILRTKIHGDEKYLRPGYYNSNSTTQTSSLLIDYYEQLSEKQKYSVFTCLAFELDFVYRIFPEELNSHKQILRIMEDVPSVITSRYRRV